MKWTEQEARNYFAPGIPAWGRRASNWEPAQALIAALDTERIATQTADAIAHRFERELVAERERNAKLKAEAEEASGEIERLRDRYTTQKDYRLEMVRDLDRALHGESVARSQTPETVWFDLLNEAGLLRERNAKLERVLDAARLERQMAGTLGDELRAALDAVEDAP